MKNKVMKIAGWLLLASMATLVNAELDTATYVSVDGLGEGRVTGDMTGVGEVLIEDVWGGDLWNDGDNFQYLHDSQQYNEDFSAMVRVVSQTSAVDGRWGKGGIHARAGITTGTEQNVMTVVAAGNGSQVVAPSSGSNHNPVPARVQGRANDGSAPDGGFERPIFLDDASPLEAHADPGDPGVPEVANNFFPETTDSPAAANQVWLRLDYEAATNTFMSGVADDAGGAPGVWNWAAPVSDVPNDGDGWYIGLGYSTHSDFDIGAFDFHGITFDNWSFETGSVGGGGGDFNGDGAYTCSDIDALTTAIAAGTNDVAFDLTADSIVDLADRDAWLAEAGAENNASGGAYRLGDANLDGVVDVSDFNVWNGNKFTNNSEWCSGDFSADGVVDVSDFNNWNGNKFTSSDHAVTNLSGPIGDGGSISTVPEPSSMLLPLALMSLLAFRRRGRRS